MSTPKRRPIAAELDAEHEPDDFGVARSARLDAVGFEVRIVDAPAGGGEARVEVARDALADRAEVGSRSVGTK